MHLYLYSFFGGMTGGGYGEIRIKCLPPYAWQTRNFLCLGNPTSSQIELQVLDIKSGLSLATSDLWVYVTILLDFLSGFDMVRQVWRV